MSEMRTFRLLEHEYVVARLTPDEPVASELMRGEFWSVTRTPEELSIVTRATFAPPNVRLERGWRTLQLLGPIPFETTGVAAAFTTALADRGISVFVISTYDTDYLLVKEETLERAIEALRNGGFRTEV